MLNMKIGKKRLLNEISNDGDDDQVPSGPLFKTNSIFGGLGKQTPPLFNHDEVSMTTTMANSVSN